ncbi:MAG TPA: hypothetical protein VG326_21485 [Tepidisphaeraceae bacterium]|nr:hypothetical protein [Tepidisphaeraceae bacterium]
MQRPSELFHLRTDKFGSIAIPRHDYGVTGTGACVDCMADGVSAKSSASMNGTYVVTRNGDCCWTAFSAIGGGPVAGTIDYYFNDTCSGAVAQTNDWAFNLCHLSDGTFSFQIIDGNDFGIMFDQVFSSPGCCVSFTLNSAITTTGCYTGTDGGLYMAMASGGTAVFTPC